MTSPRLNLLVIRSEEPARAIGFYELLGLYFLEEQQGKVLHQLVAHIKTTAQP